MAIVRWFITVAVACIPVALDARAPKLDLNDVTWLWPVPKSTDDVEKLISIGSLTSEDGDAVFTDQHFEDIMRASENDASVVGAHRIELPETVRAKSVWRIVAFRVDPTAPGGHQIVRENFGERPQIRLILQPVTIVSGQVEVHDVAVHLVYDFLTGPQGEPATLPDKERFRRIVDDLDSLKKLANDASIDTNGTPLGVHPGLAAEVPGLRPQVEEFLSRHLNADNLGAMALMGLDGPEPWIFVALGKHPGGDRFGPLAFLPAQMISFRSRAGVVSPAPKVNNRNPVPSKFTMPEKEQDRRGVATAVMFDRTFDPDAFAVIGKDANGNPVVDDELHNRDIPDLIADPIRSHFFNTDCVSCHTETRRRMRFSLPFGDFAYKTDGQLPAVAADVLPRDDWNVRNLGWFPPSRFIGGGPTVPTITQRTANETAEVVEFIENNYRDNGPVKPSRDDAARTDPQSDSDQKFVYSGHNAEYLEQGWTDEDRQRFYFQGQGSQLVPYYWFINLELADSEELLRSDRHLASLGCIPQEPNAEWNQDGLPIGFVKDSNPATIAMKAGFLGPQKEHYPRLMNDWLGLTCATCHTADLTHKGKIIRIDGGAAMTDIESFLAALAASMRATVSDSAKFTRFEGRLRESTAGDIDTTGLHQELESYTTVIERLVERNKGLHAYGWGRLDAFGAILNQICEAALEIPENRRPASAPVSYPFLWNTPDLDWVQWNSSANIPISRNLGEVLGVFAHMQLTHTPAGKQFTSSARVDFLLELERTVSKLQAPEWPEEHFGEIDVAKAAAGRVLFMDNCAKCHNTRDENGNFEMTPPNEFGRRFIKTKSIPFDEIGTDPHMAVNFVTRTAKPGVLADAIKPDLEDPAFDALLASIERRLAALDHPKPNFSAEVPAGILLRAAVRGVLKRDLEDRFQNRSENEKQQMMLNLMGHRMPATPPNGGAGYKARPLNGVWATAPFGHAGAVPNLYQWLLPADERVESFHIGSREFDAKHVGLSTEPVEGTFLFRTETEDGNPIPGNSNKGHTGPGHTDFTDEQRWQIVEYIKTLK